MLHCTQKVHGEPQEHQVMVRVFWDGKIDQKRVDTALLAQCFCHLDVEKCAIRAKTFCLFAWFRCFQEEFDFSNDDRFDVTTTLSLGDRGNKSNNDDCTTPMGDGTHKKETGPHWKKVWVCPQST